MSRGTYEPMFYDKTFQSILSESLEMIDDRFDKREGSVIYDALAPMSLEVSLLYQYLDFLFKNAFADTSNRHWLMQRAKERGIEPFPASPAVIVGKFNARLREGDRFFIDNIYYTVETFLEEKEEFFFYELVCEKNGTEGNKRAGNLIPTRNVEGLSTAEISHIAILGIEDEDTEKFRERYFETIQNHAYGGNIDDYRMKTRAISGVGLVKVIPVWEGGGTVKVIISDAELGEPSSELVQKVQEILDPVEQRGKGVGVAPIGHLVTVSPVKRKGINISCKITISREGEFEKIKTEIQNSLETYFKECREKWASYDRYEKSIYVQTTIRIAKIISIVLNVMNVVDFTEIKFADLEDKIYTLNENEIPYLGELSVVEVIS